MTIEFELQDASGGEEVPAEGDFRRWLAAALEDPAELGLLIRIVGEEEMRTLNSRYRGQDRPTNVLSFRTELPEAVKGSLKPEPLGDIVLCAPVVAAEALQQGKPVLDHWAHLTVHGLLHLLGHDHQQETEAQAMETLEIDILSEIGVPDPYRR